MTKQRVYWTIAILLVLLYALGPVAWIMSLSFENPEKIGAGGFLPSDFTLDNYKSLFEGPPDFRYALLNSLGIAAIATFISIVLASMAAYALARLEFAGDVHRIR